MGMPSAMPICSYGQPSGPHDHGDHGKPAEMVAVYIVMAYTVMARIATALYSYGLYGHGLYSYGLAWRSPSQAYMCRRRRNPFFFELG